MNLNEKILSIRSVMMPRDTNSMGSIFGGHILSLIDLAAAEHAKSVAPRKFVTKVMKDVNFIAPVCVGDSVSFYTTLRKIGRTSVTIEVEVDAKRYSDSNNCQEEVRVTTAEIVFVAVDDDGNSIPVFEMV